MIVNTREQYTVKKVLDSDSDFDCAVLHTSTHTHIDTVHYHISIQIDRQKMFDDLRSYLIDQFAHHTALRYVKAYTKILYRQSQHPHNPVTHTVDYHSQRELRELNQCIFYRYTALASSAVLIGIPLYFLRRRILYTRTHTSSYKYTHINRNTPLQKSATLLLCGSMIIYGILGRFPSDACYADYMTYCDSDVARRARLIYNNTVDSFRLKYQNHRDSVNSDTLSYPSSSHYYYIKPQYEELDRDVVVFHDSTSHSNSSNSDDDWKQ